MPRAVPILTHGLWSTWDPTQPEMGDEIFSELAKFVGKSVTLTEVSYYLGGRPLPAITAKVELGGLANAQTEGFLRFYHTGQLHLQITVGTEILFTEDGFQAWFPGEKRHLIVQSI